MAAFSLEPLKTRDLKVKNQLDQGMVYGQDPQWLKILSRRLRWMNIPNLPMVFVAIQALGFLMISSSFAWFERLALVPDLVYQGEFWRVLTFLALPMSHSLIGILFGLTFAYFILDSIQSLWGSFKTTFYVLSSIVLTVAFSLIFNFPITRVSGFVSTWFLAAATLYPDREIQIYFVLPIKLKYLGWLAAAFVLLQFLQGSWMERFYLLTVWANYLLFFGPLVIDRFRNWQRRRRYRSQWR